MGESVLELREITKRYGEFTAVDSLSLEIPEGAIYGFLGPNGAGKTTTIRIILDIIRPSSGSVAVFGRRSALEVRSRLGYLPEEKGLYKKMKVWAIVAYFAMLKGMDRTAARRRARELLDRYGLGAFADRRTEALSKGMGQKVQVLAAIAHDPDFVILDEPFSGLDPVNQEVMEQVIREMAERGKTVLFSTHVMQHAERICDRILLVAGGRKVFDGGIAEAKAMIPRRVLLETDDDASGLAGLDGVAAATPVDEAGVPLAPGAARPTLWEVRLRERADPQAILRACFERGIRLRRFDRSDPTLHDVFVHLVGPTVVGERSR